MRKQIIALITAALSLALLCACTNKDTEGNVSTASSAINTTASAENTSQESTSTESPGADWNIVASGTQNNLMDVIWDGSRFVAVGENIVLSSEDGSSWSTEYEGTQLFIDIEYNGNVYVATIIQSTSIPTVLVSFNLKDWSEATIDRFGYASNIGIDDIGYGGGRFLAVGAASSWATSTDGINWTTQFALIEGLTSGSGSLRMSDWAGGKYILSGDSGRIFTSENAADWSYSTVTDSAGTKLDVKILSMAYAVMKDGTEIYVMGDDTGNIYTSNQEGSSPKKLSAENNIASGSGEITDICWDGSQFLAVSPNFGVILSENGLEWKNSGMSNDTSWGLRSVAFSNDTHVFVGMFGKIVVK